MYYFHETLNDFHNPIKNQMRGCSTVSSRNLHCSVVDVYLRAGLIMTQNTGSAQEPIMPRSQVRHGICVHIMLTQPKLFHVVLWVMLKDRAIACSQITRPKSQLYSEGGFNLSDGQQLGHKRAHTWQSTTAKRQKMTSEMVGSTQTCLKNHDSLSHVFVKQ